MTMKTMVLCCLLGSILISGVFCNDCKKKREQSANMAKTCCTLTRPSLNPEYISCEKNVLKSNPDLAAIGKKNWGNAEKTAYYQCVVECVYLNNGYLQLETRNTLDLVTIEAKIANYLPQPNNLTTSFLFDAYKKCEQFLKGHSSKLDIKSNDVESISDSCISFPIQIETCVHIYAMQECPDMFYIQNNNCKEAQQYFKNCMASVKRF